MAAYRKGHRRNPLRMPRYGPHGELETAFEELKATVEPVPARERIYKSWISSGTWALIDRRAALRKAGDLAGRKRARLACQIEKALSQDRRRRAEEAGSVIEGHLIQGRVKEAWRTLKGWYRVSEGKAPRPSLQTMERQTSERVELYARATPTGDPLPINVEPFEVREETPSDGELRDLVARRIHNGRSGGGSGIRGEDLKGWLRGIVWEEKQEREMARQEGDCEGDGGGTEGPATLGGPS